MRRISNKRRRSLAARKRAVHDSLAAQGFKCWGVDHLYGHSCQGGYVGHEPLLRSRGGDPTDAAQVVVICSGLHDEIHRNPEWAEEVGLMLSGGVRYSEGRLLR